MAVASSLAMTGWMTPRFSIAVTFLAFGLGVGFWGGSVAVVTARADVSPDVLGGAFFAFGIAQLLGFGAAGRIATAVSLKHRLLLLLAAIAVCLALLLQVTGPAALIAGLFMFSFLGSCIDLIMNSEAVAVEHELGKPVMSGFHALASLGLALGSIAGSWLSVSFGVIATAMLGFATYGAAIAVAWIATPDRGPTASRSSGGTGFFKLRFAFVALALIAGCTMAIEMSAVMFSANALTELAPTLAAYAGAGAMVYAFLQAGVRATGDTLRARLGDARLIAISSAIALAGLAVLCFAQGPAMAIAGLAMIGIGTACIVPAAFILAPRVAGVPAVSAISVLAVIGAPPRIVMPLIYGLAASQIGYISAYGVYLALAAIMLLLSIWMLRAQANEVPS
jgi:hypothetical protein